MKIAIHQPKLLSYIGYWQLINSVDTFIIFDDVNFVKKAFINYNYILVNKQPFKFTLELIGASQNKLINEIEIGNNSGKILKTIELNYKKSSNFKYAFPILENIFANSEKNLAKFIGYSLIEISKYLEIETKFVFSSDIIKNNKLKGQDKVIEICNKLNANYYIQVIGGKHLYDDNEFLANEIKIKFLNTKLNEFNQLTNDLSINLSIIDIIMNKNKYQITKILNNFSFT